MNNKVIKITSHPFFLALPYNFCCWYFFLFFRVLLLLHFDLQPQLAQIFSLNPVFMWISCFHCFPPSVSIFLSFFFLSFFFFCLTEFHCHRFIFQRESWGFILWSFKFWNCLLPFYLKTNWVGIRFGDPFSFKMLHFNY